ncbi:hypothetical protein CM19_00890 [Candidatus Acidianus copahuensis]|uniref:Cas12f1-like TNB domain-containing protein n=1 Tax=Candidatus Acidianus copahuensis TaxID=1160895 RepID=A0A031LUU1_9CREN|nr:zinc ribbon domain-containing protein [Candidatus Acidianus copahuensis]EZQ11535.1 hypothetical protein CM19_00890 [Candidatus Acidianus copahuensis]
MRLPIVKSDNKTTIFELPKREIIRAYKLPLKDERLKPFIDFYLTLVRKALQEIWENTRIEKLNKNGKKRVRVKITIPKDKEFKKKLRDKLEEINNKYASHWVDSAIRTAYSIMKIWRKRAIKGKAKIRMPRITRRFVRVKSTLMRVDGEKIRITLVANKEYLHVDFSKSWFYKKDMKVSEPILKEDSVILVFKKDLPLTTPLYAIGLDTNLYTLDGVTVDGKEVHESIKDIFTLKVSMSNKKAKIQSLSSKKQKNMKKVKEKYSHREKNKVKDLVYKKVHEFLNDHRNSIIAIERLNKVKMFNDVSRSLSRKISRTSWRLFHTVLKEKAGEYNSFVIEVDPYLTSKSCSRCGWVDPNLGASKVFICRCGLRIDRQINAGINILLRMCGFPHIPGVFDKVFRIMGGVIPLRGRIVMMSFGSERDEAQGFYGHDNKCP